MLLAVALTVCAGVGRDGPHAVSSAPAAVAAVLVVLARTDCVSGAKTPWPTFSAGVAAAAAAVSASVSQTAAVMIAVLRIPVFCSWCSTLFVVTRLFVVLWWSLPGAGVVVVMVMVAAAVVAAALRRVAAAAAAAAAAASVWHCLSCGWR